MKARHLFLVSHDVQVDWHSCFAEAFREQDPRNVVVVFVHGTADAERARRRQCYNVVVDLLEGFRFDRAAPPPPIHPGILDLENALETSFFWDDVRVDRWLMARNDVNYTLQYLNHAFTNFIAAYRAMEPVAAVGEVTMAIYRLMQRTLAKDGKPMLQPTSTRYFARYYCDPSLTWDWARCIDLYHRYVRDGVPPEVEAQVRPFYETIVRGSGKPTAYEVFQKTASTGFTELDRLSIGALISKTIGAFRPGPDRDERERNLRAAYMEIGPVRKARRMVAERRNYAAYTQLTNDLPEGAKFGVYFLHFQPEYTADGLGRFYAEQQFLVRNIAAALPGNMRLVVKDHLAMAGLRHPDFYRHIRQNQNVVLAHHSVDSRQLIRGSDIVFTIVGTPALEAMFIGRPAIMFGRYAFANTNLIEFCASFWELGDMIRRKMSEQVDQQEVRKHALALLAAKFSGSRPGQLPTAAERIQEFLAERVNFETVKRSFVEELNSRGLLT